MKRIAVFCGSSFGTDKIYEEHATALGQFLAHENIGVVYGGANVGLMGALANGALSAGGEVLGVLPEFLQSKEIAHPDISELIIVPSMHERKARMNSLCDGVIALPGGFGTIEELFEMLTWGQLGLHQKPIGILNIDGFYTELMQLLSKMVDKGFLKRDNFDMVIVEDGIDALVKRMKEYLPPTADKWLAKEKIGPID